MISQTAIAEIERLQDDGLKPTPADIIRLNALGLKLEMARKRCALTSLDYLPRVAAITPTVTFRQPTVGHELWLDRVERLTAPTYETALAVKAFALSRPASALPDPDDPSVVEKAVAAYAATFADVTRDQIFAALDYVINGPSPLVGERPARPAPSNPDEPSLGDEEDWRFCVAAGILHEAKAVMLGVSQAELEALTRRQLEDLIRRAYLYHKIECSDADAEAVDFYATVDEIRARLESCCRTLAVSNEKEGL